MRYAHGIAAMAALAIVAGALSAGAVTVTRDDAPARDVAASTPERLAQAPGRRPPPRGPGGGPPPARQHTINHAQKLTLLPATVAPIAANRVTIAVEGNSRVIRSNSISRHDTGAFPNRNNPNSIAEQSIAYALPLKPQRAGAPTYYQLGTFGVAVNGVAFEPQAAEWYLGQRGSKWQYDPLGGAIPLGLDENVAHVQPNGLYHYHGEPLGLLQNLGATGGRHSPLVGWALDGFPIYALYGQDESGQVREMLSGWKLRDGARPDGNGEPGGVHDGAFVTDWQYVEGAGDLDACNGRNAVTPEFPNGTYAYFLTRTFPVVPRCFAGTPIPGAVVMDMSGRRLN